MTPAQEFLQRWHDCVAGRDPAGLEPIISDSARLFSPAFFKPKEGKAQVMQVLTAVLQVLADFRYAGEWVEGDEIILLFEGSVGGKQLRGIDRIKLDNQGRLTELEVFVRPANGLQALAEAMQRTLTGQI